MRDSIFHCVQFSLILHHLNKNVERKCGMSLVQWVLLDTLLEIPAVTAHTLAAELGIHPSTLTQTLKRLKKRGLVYISADPRDLRKKLISITRAGKKQLSQCDPWMSKLNRDLGAHGGAMTIAMNQLSSLSGSLKSFT